MKKHWFIALGSFLLFSALCITATTLLIQKHTPAVDDGIRGIDVYGTYDQNDLILNHIPVDGYGEEISVLQIDGLRDEAVQKSVNEAILTKAKTLLSQLGEPNYADFAVSANFANVLSVTFYMGGTERYLNGNLNFDLTTGKELHISDLFYDHVDLLALVRHGFYRALAQQDAWGREGLASPDEDKLFLLVSRFMEQPDPEFYFTPAELWFTQDDVTASIDFLSVAEDVCIYEKYLTKESIFTRDDVGFKNLFTCSLGNYEPFDHIDYGYALDNLWYDVTMWNYALHEDQFKDTEAVNRFKEDALGRSYELVEKYKKIAQENPDKGYILMLKPGYDLIAIQHYHAEGWHTEFSDAVEVYENGLLYEMPIELFENDYKRRIITAYRSKYIVLSGGVYLSGELDGATLTELRETTLQNYKTGHIYTDLDEVFAIDEDFYLSLISARVVEHLMCWYGPDRTRAEAEALAKDMVCTLNGAYITVFLPQVPDLNPSYRLNEFDAAYLTIFPKEEA